MILLFNCVDINSTQILVGFDSFDHLFIFEMKKKEDKWQVNLFFSNYKQGLEKPSSVS